MQLTTLYEDHANHCAVNNIRLVWPTYLGQMMDESVSSFC